MHELSTKRKQILFVFQVVPSILFFYAALVLSIWIRYPAGLTPLEWRQHLVAFSAVFVLWLLPLYAHRLFEWRPFESLSRTVVTLASAAATNAAVAILYFYVQPSLVLTPRRFLLMVVGFSFLLLCLWYGYVLRKLQTKIVEPWYILGESTEWEELADACRAAQSRGVAFQGYVYPQSPAWHALTAGSVVVVPEYNALSVEHAHELFAVRQNGVVFLGHTQAVELLHMRVPIHSLAEQWFLEHVHYGKRTGWLLKRVLDLVLGALMFIVFVLTFPFIALAIRLSSAGPIFFTQERVGYLGRIFTIVKYRTMRVGSGDTWTAAADARITPVGKILRRLRLDELPQSMAILAGTMSLVGPRPEQVHIVDMLRKEIPFYDERHAVLPGLTGWAQLHVYAASIAESKEKLSYDLYYVKHQSVRFDLEILLKTAYMVLLGGHR